MANVIGLTRPLVPYLICGLYLLHWLPMTRYHRKTCTTACHDHPNQVLIHTSGGQFFEDCPGYVNVWYIRACSATGSAAASRQLLAISTFVTTPHHRK